jgi:hypothetical protein
MKKVFLTLLIGVAGTASFAQTSKAIITSGNSINGSSAQIADFNPANLTFTNVQEVANVTSIPRDFIYDAKNGHAIYQDKNNSLVFATISNKGITSKNFNMMNTVMAPAYIPASEEVVCFNVQKEFNGYGSNEENLFLSKIDVTKGTTKNLIKFNDLSFDNVTAPFYGKTEVMDRFNPNNKMKDKEVAISKPLYIAEKDLYIVMVRDVTGTNRLYKIHVNTPGNVVSNRCDYNIIDMAHVAGTDIAKTLFFEQSGTTSTFKVGDLDLNTNIMSNISVVGTSTTSGKVLVNNGSIKFNADQSQLYVSHFDGNQTNIATIAIEDNSKAAVSNYNGYVQFDFGFSSTAYQKPTYATYFGLYPNPTSTGIVNFKNNSGVQANSISVYDNVGQLVRFIKVEEISQSIAIDLTGMANGIYHITVDMPGQDFQGKVAVTN